MKGFRWMLVMSALAVAACDGARSPDFVPEREVVSFTITNSAGQPETDDQIDLPVGTTEQLTAHADLATTVPPGYVRGPDEEAYTLDGKPAVLHRNVDVTSDVSWDINDDNTATISSSGLVTGVQQGATTVTAAYAGEDDTINVVVTAASLAGGQVVCVRPATSGAVDSTPCVANGSFSRPAGVTVPFEAIGRFTDGQNRRIAAPYVLSWISSETAVASKEGSDNNVPFTSNDFATRTVGATTITGTVVSGSNPLPDPASRSATLNVVAANAFCETEFPSGSTIVPQTCIGCTANNTNLIVDGNLDTFADLNIPLGLLLLSNISITVANPVGTPPVAAGAPVGFLLSRTSNNILAAQLLGSLEVTTVTRVGVTDTFVEVADPATSSELLRLTLLGIRLPAAPQFLLSTGPTTLPYDGVKLTFRGGLLALLTSLNVNTACSRANPNPPAAP